MREERERSTVEAENIQWLRGRIQTVTEGKISQLQKNSEITLGDFWLFVNVNVLCEDCDQRFGILDLLDRGGCDCAVEE